MAQLPQGHTQPAPNLDAFRALADRYPLAAPELVARRELRSRADSKFVLASSAAADLVRVLASDYAVLAAGTERIASYDTLYFDTPDLACFDAHRRGRRVRHKVRVRHYPDRRLSFLEVKTRRSELRTTKACRERDYGDDVLSASDHAFVRLHAGLDESVLPQAWTSFRRITLVGIHSCERVTVDIGLVVHMGRHERQLGAVNIVEVKQWPFRRHTPAMSALRNAGHRPCSVSKYCAAITWMHPEVQHNRLLPGLRELERGAA